MAGQTWLYKWNDRGRFHEGKGRDWAEVFNRGGVEEGFGFANPVGRALLADVQKGDRVIAYQTDQRAAVGLCEIIKVKRTGDDPSIVIRPVRKFARPVPLHDLKKDDPALQTVQALRQGPVQSFYALNPSEATAILEACEAFQVADTAGDELRAVETADEIAQSLKSFIGSAGVYPDTTRNLFSSTDYWVFSPALGAFGPAKFVGLAGMTFPRYQHYQELQRQGRKPPVFDGNRTQRAIRRVLGSEFATDAGLAERLRAWGEGLFGAGAFGGATGAAWTFIALSDGVTSPFRVGRRYTRDDIYRLRNVPADLQGGNWDTGYTRYRDEWYIFAGVGTAGRTGHNYGNRWVGDVLEWRGKTNSRIRHESIRSMVSGNHPVHLFTREQDRSPFVYEGAVRATGTRDTTPVTVFWQAEQGGNFPDEVKAPEKYIEGATKTVTVNVYERNPAARRKCIDHYGPRCAVCKLEFVTRYGDIGEGFIHVHHVKSLSEIGEEYEVDPINDLRPVCPNCHAMLHRSAPPLATDELRARLRL